MGGLGCKNELLNHGSLMQSGTKYDGIMLETLRISYLDEVAAQNVLFYRRYQIY